MTKMAWAGAPGLKKKLGNWTGPSVRRDGFGETQEQLLNTCGWIFVKVEPSTEVHSGGHERE